MLAPRNLTVLLKNIFLITKKIICVIISDCKSVTEYKYYE